MEIKAIEQETERNPLTFTIDELNFTLRTNNCLKRAGIHTLSELCNMTENELKQVRNLGQHSLEEIKTRVAEYGLSLAKMKKLKTRDGFAGTNANKHIQAINALKFLDKYCNSVFDEKSIGCEGCVFYPQNEGEFCPLRNSFTRMMFANWSMRARKLKDDGGLKCGSD